MDTVSIFCAIDDFCKLFGPRWQQHLPGTRAAIRITTNDLISSQSPTPSGLSP